MLLLVFNFIFNLAEGGGLTFGCKKPYNCVLADYINIFISFTYLYISMMDHKLGTK